MISVRQAINRAVWQRCTAHAGSPSAGTASSAGTAIRARSDTSGRRRRPPRHRAGHQVGRRSGFRPVQAIAGYGTGDCAGQPRQQLRQIAVPAGPGNRCFRLAAGHRPSLIAGIIWLRLRQSRAGRAHAGSATAVSGRASTGRAALQAPGQAITGRFRFTGTTHRFGRSIIHNHNQQYNRRNRRQVYRRPLIQPAAFQQPTQSIRPLRLLTPALRQHSTPIILSFQYYVYCAITAPPRRPHQRPLHCSRHCAPTVIHHSAFIARRNRVMLPPLRSINYATGIGLPPSVTGFSTPAGCRIPLRPPTAFTVFRQ